MTFFFQMNKWIDEIDDEYMEKINKSKLIKTNSLKSIHRYKLVIQWIDEWNELDEYMDEWELKLINGWFN